MSLRNSLLKQFGRPVGTLGLIAGWLMEKSNKERNKWMMDKVQFSESDRVLEIGFGTGDTCKEVASILTRGFIAGVDHSKLMYQQSMKRMKEFIDEKRAALHWGTVWELKYPSNYFDVVYASNVHFFWPDPSLEFVQLRQFLKPKGKIVMVFQPRWIRSEEDILRIAESTRLNLMEAGFRNVQVELKQMKPVTGVLVSAEK